MRGVIRKVVADKGFAFVSVDGGQDAFVHCSDVVGVPFELLSVGREISFEIEETRKGLRARRVVL